MLRLRVRSRRHQHSRRPIWCRRGFSIVELFAALVVTSILVLLVLPRYARYKHRYHVSTLVGQLRNLAAGEESYWNAVGTYTSNLRMLRLADRPQVTITVLSADSTGWSATARYAGDSTTCAIYYGRAPALPPATSKNVIGCTP